MDYGWLMHGSCMAYARIMHGLCMHVLCTDYAWIITIMHGLCMDYSWNVCVWIMYEICMDKTSACFGLDKTWMMDYAYIMHGLCAVQRSIAR